MNMPRKTVSAFLASLALNIVTSTILSASADQSIVGSHAARVVREQHALRSFLETYTRPVPHQSCQQLMTGTSTGISFVTHEALFLQRSPVATAEKTATWSTKHVTRPPGALETLAAAMDRNQSEVYLWLPQFGRFVGEDLFVQYLERVQEFRIALHAAENELAIEYSWGHASIPGIHNFLRDARAWGESRRVVFKIDAINRDTIPTGEYSGRVFTATFAILP